VVIPGRDHRPKADDREPGIQESLSPVTGFRVRLRFASAPRNDEVDVRCDMIDFMESLYYSSPCGKGGNMLAPAIDRPAPAATRRARSRSGCRVRSTPPQWEGPSRSICWDGSWGQRGPVSGLGEDREPTRRETLERKAFQGQATGPAVPHKLLSRRARGRYRRSQP
jgi:hypothetical protein